MNTVETFYQAFSEMDAEKMVNLYADDVVFEDPAFGILHGEHAKNMWRMLIESQKDKKFKVIYSDVLLNETQPATSGAAKWEAFYIFSKTGRPVHNIIDAHFEIIDGKITKHTDHFSLHKWAKQALGFKGVLLGGTRFFKKSLQQQTGTLLSKYEAKRK